MFCFGLRLWWSEVERFLFLFRAKLAREQRRKGLCFVSSYACVEAKSNCFFCFVHSSQGSKDAKVYVLFRATLLLEQSRKVFVFVSRKARKGAKTQRFIFCFELSLWWSEVELFFVSRKARKGAKTQRFMFCTKLLIKRRREKLINYLQFYECHLSLSSH